MAHSCTQCALVASTPPAHPWLVPKGPWERVHVDHAQWNKTLLLVAVDTFSKWPEVFVVSSTSATQTADKLRIMFATRGLPLILVSDNGTPFSSTVDCSRPKYLTMFFAVRYMQIFTLNTFLV